MTDQKPTPDAVLAECEGKRLLPYSPRQLREVLRAALNERDEALERARNAEAKLISIYLESSP